MKRSVDLRSKLDTAKVSVSSYMFSAWGSPWYVMFLNLYYQRLKIMLKHKDYN
ncbi:hypothetical protein Hanom_Chr17g01583691 [Helianthus anomalus]